MTFKQKMKQIGQVAVFMSLVCFMFIAGGAERMPADATFKDWINLAGAAFVALNMGLLGISFMQEDTE